ncbi:hypothetical protein AJ80_10005, partial [Polytolypa hystricis UAMH7299]
MADPLSVGGSAVGIISLGIAVCDGLVRYYRSWKDCGGDVEAMLESIESLMGSFQCLGPCLESDGLNKDLVKQVEASIKLSRNRVESLDRELEKLKREANPNMRQKIHFQSRRLLYPFKQDTIRGLGERVSSLKGNVSIALEALQLDTSEVILMETRGVGDSVNAAVDLLAKAEKDERKRAILNWLNPPDPYSNYNAACKQREKDTGTWFLKGHEYATWRDTSNSILWLHGIPGCGKTVLSSTVLKDVFQRYQHTSRIAFFYFSFNDKGKQSTHMLLASLIKQLSTQCPTTPKALIDLYSCHNDGQQLPTTDELMETLRIIIGDTHQTYIILDALDECEEWEDLLENIEEIFRWNIANLHLLVTSRREKMIEDVFEDFVKTQVCLQNKLVDGDIRLHIHQQLLIDRKLRRWPSETKKEIEEALANGANGMFRWAACQLDELRTCRTPNSVRNALNTLPKDLDDTYERILLNIPENGRQDVLTILKWLAFSTCPVSVSEVAEALTIDLGHQPPLFDSTRRYFDPRDILELCSSLVTVSRKESDEEGFFEYLGNVEARLSLAHFSVKEYLVSDRIKYGKASEYSINKICADQCITECCLAYLLQFNTPDAPTTRRKSPLIRYAACRWSYHARVVEDKVNVMRLIMDLFLLNRNAYRNWLCNRRISEFLLPLYLASDLGLVNIAKTLIVQGAEVNAQAEFNQGGYYGNALQAAS